MAAKEQGQHIVKTAIYISQLSKCTECVHLNYVGFSKFYYCMYCMLVYNMCIYVYTLCFCCCCCFSSNVPFLLTNYSDKIIAWPKFARSQIFYAKKSSDNKMSSKIFHILWSDRHMLDYLYRHSYYEVRLHHTQE